MDASVSKRLQAMDHEIFAAWVEKKKHQEGWSRRWLVVAPLTLISYKSDEPGAVPSKVLDLNGVTIVQQFDRIIHIRGRHKAPPYTFRLESKADMPLWLKAFSEALRPVSVAESADEEENYPPTPSKVPVSSTPSLAPAASHPGVSDGKAGTKNIYSGWAQKKGVLGTWRRRWLVCSKWQLSTFKTDHAGAEPTKVLDLHNTSCEYTATQITVASRHASNAKTYEFRFESPTDVSAWLAAFAEATDNTMQTTQRSPSATATPTQPMSPVVRTEAKSPPKPSSGAIFSGWALKKGMLNTWRKRWLVASRWTLTTYKTDKPGALPTKQLDLRGVQFVREGDRLLHVHAPHRHYEFQMDSKDAMELWVAALSSATSEFL